MFETFSKLLSLTKFYSYFKALNVFIFEIAIAGKYDANDDINKDEKKLLK